MKRRLFLLPALLCGSLMAQPHQEEHMLPGPPPDSLEFRPGEEDVRLLAQAPGPNRGPAVPGKPVPPPPQGIGGSGRGGQPPSPPNAPSRPGDMHNRLAGIVQRGPGAPFEGMAKRTLIVGAAKLDDAARQSLQEDLQIMSSVLDKAVERAMEGSQERRMGIAVTALPGLRGENIYLEDYGTLFLLNVPMPLAGPKKPESATAAKEDSDWEEAKRDLYQKRPIGMFEPMKYDAQKVETLKKELLEALKNGSNIRQLKPDQSITIVVTGAETPPVVMNRMNVSKRDGEPQKEDKQAMERRIIAPQQTTLTIRARKADVDAFAKGKLGAEEFAKKASINTN